jgi:hypothetical protein
MRILRAIKPGVPRSRRKARAAARRIRRAAKRARAIIKPAPVRSTLISPYAEQRSRYLDNLIRTATGLDLKGPVRRMGERTRPTAAVEGFDLSTGPRKLLAKMIVTEPNDGGREKMKPDRWTKRLTERRA